MENQSREDRREALIAEIQTVLKGEAPAPLVGHLFLRLKSCCDRGEWLPALRRLRPERTGVSALSQWATRQIKRAQEARPAKPAPRHALSDEGERLARRLLAIDQEPEPGRSTLLGIEAERCRCSVRTLRRKLRWLKGAEDVSLSRKVRSDEGSIRVISPEAQRFFLERRLNPMTRHEQVSISIRHTRRRFPEDDASDSVYYRLAKKEIPAAAVMSDEQRRRTFIPGKHWEVPHPNHTHTLDFTKADVWVWDGDRDEKPYRPSMTVVIDEHTRSCMFGMYTKQTPNSEILQAVLLHSWLPKRNPLWVQHGIPLHLHCDNGKVQHSSWLIEVCRSIRAELGGSRSSWIDGGQHIHHTETYSPWQQGKVERMIGLVHQHYESQLGAGYCGSDPKDPPDCFADPKHGITSWRQYPTLATLNEGFQAWVTGEYHVERHSVLRRSRLQYWQDHAEPYIALPQNPEHLRMMLLQRDGTRKITRGRVKVNGSSYWAPDLQRREGERVLVRSDPAEPSRVLVLDLVGVPICEPARDEVNCVGNPDDQAQLRTYRREVRAEGRAIERTARLRAGMPAKEKPAYVETLHEAESQQPIPLPSKVRKLKRQLPDERPPAEVDDVIAGAQDEEKAPVYSWSDEGDGGP